MTGAGGRTWRTALSPEQRAALKRIDRRQGRMTACAVRATPTATALADAGLLDVLGQADGWMTVRISDAGRAALKETT